MLTPRGAPKLKDGRLSGDAVFMHLVRGSMRLALVLAALLVALPAVSTGQDTQPQCSDQVDNDADGAIDGADAGCSDGSDEDETDSIYAGIVKITVALPVVSLQGTVDRKGVVDVSRLTVRAQRGSVVAITCTGKRCPFKSLRRTMISSTLRLGKLERTLRPPLTLKLRIARTGQLGKYVRYKVRRRKAPKRFDACLDQTSQAVRGCFDE